MDELNKLLGLGLQRSPGDITRDRVSVNDLWVGGDWLQRSPGDITRDRRSASAALSSS